MRAAFVLAVTVACRPSPGTDPPAAPVRASAGCGTTPGAIVRGEIEVDGRTRSFVLDLPDDYDATRPLPLAYGFHGNWDSGAGAREGYRLARAWGEPIVAVYPDGVREAEDGPTTWAFAPGSRDFAFFDALHEAVTAQLCVDLDRVFVLGYSSGGFMANAIACARGELVRGVGAISAGLDATRCDHPVAAWLAHGEADAIVPIEHGVRARDAWIATNACTAPAVAEASGCERHACAEPIVWCRHAGEHRLLPHASEAAVDFFKSLPPRTNATVRSSRAL